MFVKVARHQAGLIVIEPRSQDSASGKATDAPHDATLTEFLAYLATRDPENAGGEAAVHSPADPADVLALFGNRFQNGRSPRLGDGRLKANVRSLAHELELALARTRRAIAQAR
jgi:hypothetical protein